jgi:NAD(P)-dependent dehydrogenase (short-subunit alcohol dehydrogenase family)
MAGRLAGKVAVVTGAAPRGEGVGNGMATAIVFAREGAKVILVNRDASRAEKLAAVIAKDGGDAAVFAGDVTKPDVAEAMAAFATRRYGSGSAWVSGNCSERVVRVGSWGYDPRFLRSAYRWAIPTAFRFMDRGFRVARTL